MNDNKKILLIIAAIPMASIFIIYFILKVTFDLSLSPMERKLFTFKYETVPKIVEKKYLQFNLLKNPFTNSRVTPQRDFPTPPLAGLSPPPTGASKKVTLILINQSRRMAIIDDKAVNIGDRVDNYSVKAIEKNRVLLKNKEGEIWLILE
jgi:hypothetical protein